MPSVIQMMVLIPSAALSMIASAAKAGGTKIIDTSAPVSETASLTVLYTGRSRCVCPPFPGVTPPTTLVPYSIICSAWKVPSLPVNPCTITFESLFTKTAIYIFFNSANVLNFELLKKLNFIFVIKHIKQNSLTNVHLHNFHLLLLIMNVPNVYHLLFSNVHIRLDCYSPNDRKPKLLKSSIHPNVLNVHLLYLKLQPLA